MKFGEVKEPKSQDFRCLEKFAWLPVRIHGGLVIWMERYYEWQKYYAACSGPLDWHTSMAWHTQCYRLEYKADPYEI